MNNSSERAAILYGEALQEAEKSNPDVPKVIALLERAIEGGDSKAMYALATWYLNGRQPYVSIDHAKAFPLLEKAAAAQNPDALHDLAVCFDRGWAVAEDKRKAFEYYLQAALLGDAQSFYEVGRCYYHGSGVDHDSRLSEIWLDRAEQLGISAETGEPSESS